MDETNTPNDSFDLDMDQAKEGAADFLAEVKDDLKNEATAVEDSTEQRVEGLVLSGEDAKAAQKVVEEAIEKKDVTATDLDNLLSDLGVDKMYDSAKSYLSDIEELPETAYDLTMIMIGKLKELVTDAEIVDATPIGEAVETSPEKVPDPFVGPVEDPPVAAPDPFVGPVEDPPVAAPDPFVGPVEDPPVAAPDPDPFVGPVQAPDPAPVDKGPAVAPVPAPAEKNITPPETVEKEPKNAREILESIVSFTKELAQESAASIAGSLVLIQSALENAKFRETINDLDEEEVTSVINEANKELASIPTPHEIVRNANDNFVLQEIAVIATPAPVEGEKKTPDDDKKVEGGDAEDEKKKGEKDESAEASKEDSEANKEAIAHFAKEGPFVSALANGQIEAGSGQLSDANELYLAADKKTQNNIQLILLDATRMQKTKVTFSAEGIEVSEKSFSERIGEANDFMEFITVLLSALFEGLIDGSLKVKTKPDDDDETVKGLRTQIAAKTKELKTLESADRSALKPDEQTKLDADIKKAKTELAELQEGLKGAEESSSFAKALKDSLNEEVGGTIKDLQIIDGFAHIEFIDSESLLAFQEACEKWLAAEGVTREMMSESPLGPNAIQIDLLQDEMMALMRGENPEGVFSDVGTESEPTTTTPAPFVGPVQAPDPAPFVGPVQAPDSPEVISNRKVIEDALTEISSLAADAVQEQSSDTGIDVSEQLKSIEASIKDIEGAYATAGMEGSEIERVINDTNVVLAKLEEPIQLSVTFDPTNLSIALLDAPATTTPAVAEQNEDDGTIRGVDFTPSTDTDTQLA